MYVFQLQVYNHCSMQLLKTLMLILSQLVDNVHSINQWTELQ